MTEMAVREVDTAEIDSAIRLIAETLGLVEGRPVADIRAGKLNYPYSAGSTPR